MLDIAFREDDSRIRKDHGPENMATLRHIALNLPEARQVNQGRNQIEAQECGLGRTLSVEGTQRLRCARPADR